jgi:hypothetical protein
MTNGITRRDFMNGAAATSAASRPRNAIDQAHRAVLELTA